MITYTRKQKKRGFNLTLKVEPSGEVVVYAPKLTPKFMLDQFVKKNQDWIIKQKVRLKNKKPLIGDSFVYLFGKRYSLAIKEINQPTSGFYVFKNELVYQPPATTHLPTKIPKKRLESFLKNTAESYILPRTHQLAQEMRLKFKKVSLRQQKTRWGSCSSQKNLNFNWRLVHFEPKVIDYVIIHELAHLKHMNHSKAFWSLVAQFDPDYKKHRKALKEAEY